MFRRKAISFDLAIVTLKILGSQQLRNLNMIDTNVKMVTISSQLLSLLDTKD
jgi:uncharacterized membrane protein YcaP (DUF421 family)